MKAPDNYAYEYLQNRLVDYITFKPYCDLDWIKRKIKNSNIEPEKLKELFHDIQDHKGSTRYNEIFNICRQYNFHCRAIE
ncbi:MAG: hypothetical protein ACTSO3_16190 [Candidatus Heimdallarchaeaceae archaeon]